MSQPWYTTGNAVDVPESVPEQPGIFQSLFGKAKEVMAGAWGGISDAVEGVMRGVGRWVGAPIGEAVDTGLKPLFWMLLVLGLVVIAGLFAWAKVTTRSA